MTESNQINGSRQTSAVSIFSQENTTGDFPVLKAFQEYIDAEQAKARKRMLGLSIFFAVLLMVVVVTFVFILSSVINRNQALSDRILDIALRERTLQQQPVVNVTPHPVAQPQGGNEAAMKPVLEKLENLAAAIANTQKPAPVIQQPAPVPQAVKPQAETAESVRLKEQLRIQAAKLREAEAKLKEQQRQAEIEKHRRRLYPEYYAKQEAAKQKAALDREAKELAEKSAAEKAKHTEAEIKRKPIDYFSQSDDGEDEELKALLKRKKSTGKQIQAPVVKEDTSDIQAKERTESPVINRKNASTKPVVQKQKAEKKQFPDAQPKAPKSNNEIRKSVKTETLKIGSNDDDSMLWLIESSNLN